MEVKLFCDIVLICQTGNLRMKNIFRSWINQCKIVYSTEDKVRWSWIAIRPSDSESNRDFNLSPYCNTLTQD